MRRKLTSRCSGLLRASRCAAAERHVSRHQVLKQTAIAVVVLSAIGVVLWGADVLHDREYRVTVVAPAPLYSLPPHEYPASNPVLATLPAGQPVRVLRVRYGKDFEALKGELPSGQVGWVLGGGEVKVISRGGARAG